MAVFLFDVDQTLVNSGGAGGMAMNLAFREIFGVEDGFRGVEFSGRTDTAIFRDALNLHRIPAGDFRTLLRQFEAVYVAHLARTLHETRGGVMPGIPRLVAGLAGAPGVLLGLATGNFRRGAMLKLEHFGLSTHLREGGFGEDAEDRAEMVALAVRRLDGAAQPTDSYRRAVFVVGDTPLDVEAALANGYTPVAVATGRCTVEGLRAAGAQLVFRDFADPDEALAKLLCAAGAASA